MQRSEQFAFDLGALYSRYGYAQYKMSKFEEYDLYARNKDFLISENVITFTDLSGKLMALKPDVTLSIVKNSVQTPWVQKLYYNEYVYRAGGGAAGFREILQTGLECLGDIDLCCIIEVLELACRSLQAISQQAVLDISHLGLLRQTMDSLGIPRALQSDAAVMIGRKSRHELAALCAGCGVSDSAVLEQLAALSGKPRSVLPQLEALLSGLVDADLLQQFSDVVLALDENTVNIDFSVVDDMHYYNGFICKGFVQGLPDSVLSGGQYDKLMHKMGRSDRAMGFAVYLDQLDRLPQIVSTYDVDTLILYTAATAGEATRQAALLRDAGTDTMLQKVFPDGLCCRTVIDLR